MALVYLFHLESDLLLRKPSAGSAHGCSVSGLF